MKQRFTRSADCDSDYNESPVSAKNFQKYYADLASNLSQ